MSAAWVPDLFCETHEWRSADGLSIRFVTRIDATQRMMPPVQVFTVATPNTMGSRFNGARHAERLVALPVVTPGPTDGRDVLRQWARALDPNRGEGTLTVVQGPWAGRTLPCVYDGGLDSLAEEYPNLGLTTLLFHAAEPYWTDSSESSVVAVLGQTGYKWFPFPPLILGASDIFATVSIANIGDVETWPVITAIGPGQDLTITNRLSGAIVKFTGTVAAGDTVVLDHRPGHKTATLNGNNAFSRLSVDSHLWPLASGTNPVDIGWASTTTQSKVTFAWRNRWLAA